MVNATYMDKVTRLRVPTSCSIELLAPCNLNCVHCYVTHSKKSVLTLPVIEDLFRQLAELGTLRLYLTGGEIGLRRDLFEIIAAARGHHFRVDLLTSGTLWGEKEWDRVAELGVEYVRLSLYSNQACTHDAVTKKPGSHEKTMATIDGLLARGIDVELACPVLSINAKDVGDVVAYGRERGVRVWVESHIMDKDLGGQGPKVVEASIAQIVDVYSDPRLIEHAARYDDAGCAVPSGDTRPCAVGERSAFIRCTGEVHPCVNWSTSAGNILHKSFRDIWSQGEVFAEARAVTFAQMNTCTSCGDLPACKPCVGMNRSERGAVGTPAKGICATAAAKAVAATGRSLQTHTDNDEGASSREPRLPIIAS